MIRHTVAIRALPILRVVRRGDRHSIHDLGIDVDLDLDEATAAPEERSVARAVQALAAHHAGAEPEAFALAIAQHALAHVAHVQRARVEVRESGWQRLALGGRPRDRDFAGTSAETRIARVTADSAATRVAAGFTNMRLMTLEAHGLQPLLDVWLDAVWTYGWAGIPFDTQWQQVRRALTEAYVEREHDIGAQLAHALARAVLGESPAVRTVEVRLTSARRHAIDMTAFGMENVGEVFGEMEAARGVYEVVVDREEAG